MSGGAGDAGRDVETGVIGARSIVQRGVTEVSHLVDSGGIVLFTIRKCIYRLENDVNVLVEWGGVGSGEWNGMEGGVGGVRRKKGDGSCVCGFDGVREPSHTQPYAALQMPRKLGGVFLSTGTETAITTVEFNSQIWLSRPRPMTYK